jgi:hypothetical protein
VRDDGRPFQRRLAGKNILNTGGPRPVAAYSYIHRYQGGLNLATNAAGRGDTVPLQAQQLLPGTVPTW